jgi:hypothetical protein
MSAKSTAAAAVVDLAPVANARGNPALVQGRGGAQGNFELVVPATDGGLLHLWRDNGAPGFPWRPAVRFGAELGRVDAVALVQGRFGAGNLEVVARVGTRLHCFWRDGAAPFAWHRNTDPSPALAARGNPAMVVSAAAHNNFELVVPAADGGLLHLWRDNGATNWPWRPAVPFAGDLGRVDAVALIQSSFGPFDLEVVARVGTRLFTYWREGKPPYAWHRGNNLTTEPGTRGTLSLVQSRGSVPGNFELVVAAEDRGLLHLWRDNGVPGYPWRQPTRFATDLPGTADDVALVQSTLGSTDNLEVVVRVGSRLYHYRRTGGAPGRWSRGSAIET